MSTAPAIRPGSPRAWLLAARPATLTAAIAPIAVGSASAAALEGFRTRPALAALLCSMCLQIGANFANDVFDFEKGADTEDRVGPTRATQAGLLSPRQMRAGMLVAFGLAVVFGGYLIWEAGWPVLALGVASLVAGLTYVGGPYPYGYRGLGDVAVMLFFGFVGVCGTAYVHMLEVRPLSWWCAVPIGALTTAILVVNNVRDIDTDTRAGKRTLAVRFGRNAALAEYGLLLAAAYAVPPLLLALDLAGPYALLPCLTLPVTLVLLRRLARAVRDRDAPAHNDSLKHTAQLLLLFALLFALGLVL